MIKYTRVPKLYMSYIYEGLERMLNYSGAIKPGVPEVYFFVTLLLGCFSLSFMSIDTPKSIITTSSF